MIQPAYKCVRSSLWPRLLLFKLKITNILKSSGWRLGESELPWNIAIGVLHSDQDSSI